MKTKRIKKRRNRKLSKNRINPYKGTTAQKLVERRIDVDPQDWADWDTASRIAGLSRNDFILTVVNYATQQFLKDMNRELLKVVTGDPEPEPVTTVVDNIKKDRDQPPTVHLLTSTGVEFDAVVDYDYPPEERPHILLTQSQFMDLHFDENPSCQICHRLWIKNPRFEETPVEKRDKVVPGWWIIGVPEDVHVSGSKM